MGTLTVTRDASFPQRIWGGDTVCLGTFTTAGNYATGGYLLSAADFGMQYIEQIIVQDHAGYSFDFVRSTGYLKVYSGSGAVTTGGTSGGTPAGSVAITPNAVSAGAINVTGAAYTPAGTVNGRLELATPAFSGTGYATAGQVITTTDNQTMPATSTAAGMWFIADGLPASPPVLILSNTIVAGAPAVLTVQGVPPVTDAGTYKIVTLGAATFTGTPATISPTAAMAGTHQHADTAAFTGSALATHTHTVAAAAADEAPVASLVLTGVEFICVGKGM